jgi:hypothetical protein
MVTTPSPSAPMPPQRNASSDASINALASQLASITTPDFPVPTLTTGVITANNIGATPPTASLTLSGDSTVVTAQYNDSYTPVVGDTVLVAKQGTSIVLLCQLNGTTVSGDAKNGWITIPTLGSGFTGRGNVFYRLIVDAGDNKMQFQGEVDISGTPTAVCTMPVGYRPATTRNVPIACGSGGAVLAFNTDGTVVFRPAVTDNQNTTHTHDVPSTHSHNHSGAVATSSFLDTTSLGDSVSHFHNSTPTWFSFDNVEFFL